MYDKHGCQKPECTYPKDGHDYDCYEPMKHTMDCDMGDDMDMCCPPKMPCKMEKKCVKTYKCTYKLYKVCQYRLYKVCPHCGTEFDYYEHRGMCHKCRSGMY